jgi:glycosyltransferase involved in cell wall biosynthesis
LKKLLFGITSLTIGGAERVLVDLANELCEENEITIFTIYPNGEFEKTISPKIKLKSLYNKQYKELSKIQKVLIPLRVWLQQKSIYKKHIKDNFDVEIAFLEGPITRIFSTTNKNTKKIAWIHNDISKVFGNNIKSKIKKLVDKKIYSKYDKLIFVSNDNVKKFEEVYNNTIEKEVIYNYINKDRVIEKANETPEVIFDETKTNFVTVARLVDQKAIDRLIKVHAKLIKEGYKHNFYIIGDGPLKQDLQKMIDDNQVQETFKLLGKRENPYPYMRQADYFCLLSHFEGYPMVVEEAKILNKQILITNTAAREVVRDYKNAQIFENSEKGIRH